MERYKTRVVAAGLAGVAIALAVAGEAGAQEIAAAGGAADATVHFVYAAPTGPNLTADLVAKGKVLALARRLAPRKAGPVVAVPAGRATFRATGVAAARAGSISLQRVVTLAPGRRYCLGMVKIGKGHNLLVQDVTSAALSAGALPGACGRIFARWIP
jgi:hypothetical protein